jgi:hypothetical protein
MKRRILATITLLAPFYLANPVVASSFAPQNQLNIRSLSAQPTLIAQSSWKEFYSSTGSFAVNMPGTPNEETEKDKDGLVTRSFTLKSDSDFYRISYFEVPEIGELSSGEIKEFLDVVASKFVQAADVKLLGSRNITIAGYPGKEFDFAFNKTITGKGRVYLTNNKLYLLVMVTSEQADLKKFFNSFRLIT